MRGRDAWHSLFVMPPMPAADRKLILDLGELLAQTRGRYREQLASMLNLIRDAAQTTATCCEESRYNGAACQVIPFRRIQR